MTTVSTTGLGEAIKQSGLPLVEVARHSGTDYRELSNNAVFARLPLPVLIRIAQLVDYPVAKLFWSAPDTDTPIVSDDASTVGACLGDNPQGLSRDNLARALHWDLDRVEMALRHLDARIAAAGLRLIADGAQIQIVGSPSRLPHDTRIAMARHQPGNGHVEPRLAHAVWRATFNRDLPRADREAVHQATRRRLISSIDVRARPTEPVRYSLMLIEQSH